MLNVKQGSCEYQLLKSIGLTRRRNRTLVYRLRGERSKRQLLPESTPVLRILHTFGANANVANCKQEWAKSEKKWLRFYFIQIQFNVSFRVGIFLVWFRYSFICQGTSTRRQRRDLFGLRVKLLPVATSLTTQR